MLTPEQSKALLEAHRVKDALAQQRAAIAALPESLRATGYALIARDADGQPLRGGTPTHWEQRRRLEAQAHTALDALTAQERTHIFAALLPTLGPAVELTWTFLRRQPFAGGAGRGMFRAPTRPDLTRQARGQWLSNLLSTAGDYHEDVEWLARHAGYLAQGYGGTHLAMLFAAVMDGDPAQGDAVYAVLAGAALGQDDVALLGNYVPTALLAATRPEGWDCIERLLLAAQRDEGVRQMILMAAMGAHPAAFRQLLRTVISADLARFTAVAQSVNSWLGTSWDAGPSATRTRVLARLQTLLDDPGARAQALADSSTSGPEDTYLALWSTATEDVLAALPLAATLLASAEADRRCAAVHLLAQLHLPEMLDPLVAALADGDARVVGRASSGLSIAGNLIDPASDLFERIEAALPQLPARQVPPQRPLLWDIPAPAIAREQVANLLLTSLGERDPRRLLPHLDALGSSGHARCAALLAEPAQHDPACRAALLGMLGDRTGWVRQAALKALAEGPLWPSDLPALEALLGRKAADLRRGILTLLLAQPDDTVLACADHLLDARQDLRRHAGLELLRLLHEAGHAVDASTARATAYDRMHAPLSEAERVLLAPLLGTERAVPALDDALGLADPAARTTPSAPVARAVAWTSSAAIAALLALDALIHEHREDAYTADTHTGRRDALLGSNGWLFARPDANVPVAQDVARLPFADLWRGWAQARPADQRDGDGCEFLRMLLQIEQRSAADTLALLLGLRGAGAPDNPEHADNPRLSLRYPQLLQVLCLWLARLYPVPGAADFALDHLENVLATLPAEQMRPEENEARPTWHRYNRLDQAVTLARHLSSSVDGGWTSAHAARFWRLLAWTSTLPRQHLRYQADLRQTLGAQRAGAANETDLLLQLLGPRAESGTAYSRRSFAEMTQLSARQPDRLFSDYPTLAPLYARCVERVLAVELERGEMPTAATPVALGLRALSGAQWFVRLLAALDPQHLVRGHGYADTSRAYTFSHLLRISFPIADDTPAAVAAQLAAASIPRQRLIEAALYAPQWTRHIEHALGWAGFAEAVWWVYAHTRDRQWAVDAAIRQEWEAAISERTPLASADLADGAVDVAWFQRVHARLGPARWDAIYQAAKYSSTSAGHARAQLFADAMLGQVDEHALIARIAGKRHRDSARALGLVPLPRRVRAKTMLARYEALQQFIRTARGFGAQRRAGDQTAARIGLDNLARTAGYRDAQRLQWAMELQAAADLRGGAQRVTREEITVVLRIDQLGQAHLEASRAGRSLKTIPPRLRKDPEVVRLRERHQALGEQLARMRLALEQAMCREEQFPASELQALLGHPVLAPLLEQLIFVRPDGQMGYLVANGHALRAQDGDEAALAPDVPLRIAHAFDLYRGGAWSAWQRECFAAERIQPFKQVFRELYVLTQTERDDGAVSHRYAGQQVMPRQAMALLGQRGWVTSDEYTDPSRTFHERGLTASVECLSSGGGVADLNGLTLDGVCFHAAGDAWAKPLPLAEVAPILFSEVMRDLDLVVSVAHRGGVDPESSASTVEMRAALIREVCAALALTNVRLTASHAFIQGALAEYALHLGSGTVQRLPGGALCIVPVHAQHRGRLFLPFADDDPKTAEIVSKVLLLARDREIRDPIILQQLFATA